MKRNKVNNPPQQFFGDWDYGMVFGLKLAYAGAFVRIGYVLGLANVDRFSFTDAKGRPVGDTLVRTRSLQLGLGYVRSF